MRSANASARQPWHDRLYLPAYRYAEAARFAQTTPQTVASWCRWYRVPEYRARADVVPSTSKLLSYMQLAEVAFVATFRRMGVKLEDLHRVHGDLRVVLEDEYPFALLAFKTRGPLLLPHLHNGHVLWRAIDAQGAQRVWSEPIQEQFEQFDYEQGLGLRWHPRGRNSAIVIDPRIAFGAPTVAGTGVATHILKQRYVAGEELQEIADDFAVSRHQLAEALDFEGIRIPAA